MMKRALAVFLCVGIAFLPAISHAGAGTKIPGFYKSLLPPLPKPKLPNGTETTLPELNLTVTPKSKPKAASVPATSTSSLPSDTLPVAITDNSDQGISSIITFNSSKMVVTQNAPQAIQDWASFNISANAWVQFNQQGHTNWVCLNRIFDLNPSQIFGKLTADGQIYLINQNGILFGPGSQVNVHSLIASSLNISDFDFLNGNLNFAAQDYQNSGTNAYLSALVINQGAITTDNLGSVFLLGPNVTNDVTGTIQTQAGQIGLAAGAGLSLTSGLVVTLTQTPGQATNNGQMLANTGLIGMYGQDVYQNGLINATTALKLNGNVELMASDMVYTSPTSVTESLISNSTETADQSFVFKPPVISISGLTPNRPANLVDLNGSIVAHSGTVSMYASQRVFMEDGSSIDVSGSWADLPASANTTQIQLNSVNLRDYPDQKGGILQGKYITVNNLTGSSIGDISSSLTSQDETALERSLTGGSIDIASSGDAIIKQGATLNFSGGGTNYASGYITTTALAAGNKIYPIASAPETLHYDSIMSVTTYLDSYVEGANAGLLAFYNPNSTAPRQIVLDGTILGGATRGVYQTMATELPDKMDSILYPLTGQHTYKTLGLQEPVGGTLVIGSQLPVGTYVEDADYGLGNVVLQNTVTPLPQGFGPHDQPYDPNNPGTTYLSTQKLSAAGLSSLQVSSNTTITVNEGADISLNPGGNLSLTARRIDFYGQIEIPSGNVNMTVTDNMTAIDTSSSYIQIDSVINLAQGSQINVAGQRIDNSITATGTGADAPTNFTSGGTVTIQDQSYFGQGVIAAGLIDVSGGYGISQSGAVTGGNAGKLKIQGDGIVLSSDLNGYSLVGNNGGSINLSADSITVAQNGSTPQYDLSSQQLVLSADQLILTGFTNITLSGNHDLTVDAGAVYIPSVVKLASPVPGGDDSGYNLLAVTPDLIGSSSFSATAGKALSRGLSQVANPVLDDPNAVLNVQDGAQIQVAPRGTITLNGPNGVVGGVLIAQAGAVTGNFVNFTLQSTGEISVVGYNQPSQQPVQQGLPVSYTPLPGGSVNLTANGDLTLEANSLVDVSGSHQVTTYLLNGNGAPVAQIVASNPGSISLSGGTVVPNGILTAQANLAGLQGGSLSIFSQNTNPYPLLASDLQNYINSGFDALTFQSWGSLDFQGFSQGLNYILGRSLTLDAPSFTYSGSSQDQINIQAPHIQITDTYTIGSGQTPETSRGQALLNLAAGWIDVSGAVSFSGFQNVKLSAAYDLTFSDLLYQAGWQGQMMTAADLVLQADRIYPLTLANFTVNTTGNITIEGSDSHSSSPIYSAGGSLTLVSGGQSGIDMEGGCLAAPMGQITLEAPNGSVYLSDGSTVSTAGSIPVNYGSLNDVFWTIPDKNNFTNVSGTLVTSAPINSVTITGKQVITQSGSKIDVSGSGGGSIFAYQFQGGIQGSVDPFQTGNSYVIIPNSDYSVPASVAAQAGLQVGQAVYLEGYSGLKAGIYSVLPECYAFLPGAMVVTNTGKNITSGTQQVSADGFPVIAGFLTYTGTSVRPSLMDAFEVQPASYLFKQGTFNIQGMVVGDGGNVTLNGNTTVLGGTILANALQGNTPVEVDGTALASASTYQGGVISLRGSSAFIEESSGQIPLNPGTGTLYVAADALTGFYEIDIGNLDITKGGLTQSIEMAQGSVLQATRVVLAAQNAITLDSGAQINTIDSGGNGSTSLITPTGLLTMQPNSLVHASDMVTMTIGAIDFQGGLQIDHGALNLTGQNVYFVPQGSMQTGASGLYLTSAFWGNFGNFNDVTLSASGGSSDGSTQGVVWFPGGTGSVPSNISLSAKNSFTINAAAIEWSNASDNGGVSITAPTISLQNRGGGAPQPPTLQNAGSLILNANEISVGEGPLLGGSTSANSSVNGLLIDGFSTVDFNAVHDITFNGSGSLTTGGNLNFSSARVTTSYYMDANTPYTAANFTVSTSGEVSIASNGVAPSQTVIPGGTLEIDANSIDVSGGQIQMASGTLTLNGACGVTLRGSAQVLDGGSTQTITVNGQNNYVYSPGGSVYLSSSIGPVRIGNNALVDVSGVDTKYSSDPSDLGVNAGLISIYSPSAPVKLQATMEGAAGSRPDGSVGLGGSFILDAEDLSNNTLPDKGFSALNTILNKGGFTEDIDITLRGVNSPGSTLTIGNNVVIAANNFNLTADNWSIDFKGTIDSSSLGGGGTIQFNSGGTLTLEAGSTIVSPGATVFLNIADSAPGQQGLLNFYGSIDVAGLSGQTGGTVHFRAPWSTYYGANANNITGVITGARQILAEGVLYGDTTGVSTLQVTYAADTIYEANIGNWLSGIRGFVQGAPTPAGLSPTLINCGGTAQFVPGLEVRSTGNLTLADTWDFTAGGWDSLGPGFLTLRAGTDLTIAANLVDHPTPSYTSLNSNTAQPSWGMTLVAGSANSANPAQFNVGAGDLNIGDGVLIYTESAPLRIAAGYDMTINSVPAYVGYMVNSLITYNVGTFSGQINIQTGNNLTINGGAIESATGDIDVLTGWDLDLGYQNPSTAFGAIRTTGESPSTSSRSLTQYWNYVNGGNISIHVNGNLYSNINDNSNLDSDGWDSFNTKGTSYHWSASYGNGLEPPVQGLATMGGGDLTVFTGGSFSCQAGTFRLGNLTIFSNGDMDGRFAIYQGNAELSSMSNFGSNGLHTPIEAFTAAINVYAEGNLDLGTIVNPTLARPASVVIPWDLEYRIPATSTTPAQYASASLTSATGDVTIYGDDPYYNLGNNNPTANLQRILPPTLIITAGRDIDLLNSFALAPSETGNLVLVAGRDINGSYTSQGVTQSASIIVSDASPAQAYGSTFTGNQMFDGYLHDPDNILHGSDTNPAILNAGRDIENFSLYLPKEADIYAGSDIIDMYYFGQNNSPSDVTKIQADGNILLSSNYTATASTLGIQEAGPGSFTVEAGLSIDLGTSSGIQMVGNTYNPLLPETGSTLIVAAGYSMDFSNSSSDAQFFNSLRTQGTLYSQDLADGDTAGAKQVIADTRANVISPFFSGSANKGAGDIDMTTSQISNLTGPVPTYSFTSTGARDTFFASNPNDLINGVYINVSTAAGTQLQTWNGTAWANVTQGIYILANGNLNVGLSTFITAAQTQNTGIFTAQGGPINIFAENDVNVNESRVMTFMGGDITVWSDSGNINAGRGSKTAINASPPQLVSINGEQVLLFSPPAVGSGIRAVTYAPFGVESPVPAPPEGNIYLFAPQGDINAGEAGIAGNTVILGAVQVINANNITFSGTSVGVPSSANVGGLGALSGTGAVTQGLQSQEAAIISAAAGKLAPGDASSDAFSAAWLEVRVLSFFEVDPGDGTWENTDN